MFQSRALLYFFPSSSISVYFNSTMRYCFYLLLTIFRAQEEMFNESDGLDDYTLTQTVSELEKSYLPEYSTKALADHSSDHLTKDNWDKSLMSDCQKAEKAECDEKSAEKMFCNGDLTSEVVLSQRSTLMEGSRFIDDYELEFYQEKPGQRFALKFFQCDYIEQ